jgi:hypothetical protein
LRPTGKAPSAEFATHSGIVAFELQYRQMTGHNPRILQCHNGGINADPLAWKFRCRLFRATYPGIWCICKNINIKYDKKYNSQNTQIVHSRLAPACFWLKSGLLRASANADTPGIRWEVL